MASIPCLTGCTMELVPASLYAIRLSNAQRAELESLSRRARTALDGAVSPHRAARRRRHAELRDRPARLGICAGTLASDGAITGRRVCRRPGGAELSEAGAQGRWTIMPADEDAMRLLPGGAWQPGTVQDGSTERDKDTAEITNLMTRAGNWLDGRR